MKGYTLIEIIISITILSILVSLAVPSLQELRIRNEVSSISTDFVSALYLTQSEAVRRGIPVSIASKASNWSNGWDIFSEQGTNDVRGAQDANDKLIKTFGTKHNKSTLASNNSVFSNYVTFLPSGEASGNNGTTGSFTICPSLENVSLSHTIAISRSGVVTVTNDTASCL